MLEEQRASESNFKNDIYINKNAKTPYQAVILFKSKYVGMLFRDACISGLKNQGQEFGEMCNTNCVISHLFITFTEFARGVYIDNFTTKIYFVFIKTVTIQNILMRQAQ